jgi:hypothetical protein
MKGIYPLLPKVSKEELLAWGFIFYEVDKALDHGPDHYFSTYSWYSS